MNTPREFLIWKLLALRFSAVVWHSLALSGTLWHSLTLSGTLWHSPAFSLQFSATLQILVRLFGENANFFLFTGER